jgi:hypothetical protein
MMLLIVGLAPYIVSNRLMTDGLMVSHSNEVIEALGSLFPAATDTEPSQGFFLITDSNGKAEQTWVGSSARV